VRTKELDGLKTDVESERAYRARRAVDFLHKGFASRAGAFAHSPCVRHGGKSHRDCQSKSISF
jgi:hypothetical protein